MGFAGELWPFFRPNFTNILKYLELHTTGSSACVAFIPSGKYCNFFFVFVRGLCTIRSVLKAYFLFLAWPLYQGINTYLT
jgi:hypothetical protein